MCRARVRALWHDEGDASARTPVFGSTHTHALIPHPQHTPNTHCNTAHKTNTQTPKHNQAVEDIRRVLAEAQTPGPSKYNFAQHEAAGGGNEGYEDMIDEVRRFGAAGVLAVCAVCCAACCALCAALCAAVPFCVLLRAVLFWWRSACSTAATRADNLKRLAPRAATQNTTTTARRRSTTSSTSTSRASTRRSTRSSRRRCSSAAAAAAAAAGAKARP